MKGRMMWCALVLAAASLAGCGQSEEPTDTTEPAPATAEEVEMFCDRYREVQDEDFAVMVDALVEVAPAELKDQIVRLGAESPRETYWDDREAVEEFIARCEA